MRVKKILLFFLNVINIFALIAMGCSLLSFFSPSYYFSDLLINFSYQYFLYLSLCSMVNFILNVKKTFAVATLVFALFNGIIIFPYLVGSSFEKKDTLKVLYINVLTSNDNYESVVNLIKKENPDVIGLLEISDSWVKALKPITELYPYQKIVPRSDNFGIALFSKEKFSKIEVLKSRIGIESIKGLFEFEGKPINFLLTHPVPPASEEGWGFRNEHIREIGKITAKEPHLQFVFGDFNSVLWSPIIKDFCNEAKLVPLTSFNDTWPSDFPLGFRISLDHGFISKDLIGKKKILREVGSDHLPVLYEITLRKQE